MEKKWEAQCDAAEQIAQRHGLKSALDYLIGEKLDAHVQAAATNVKFRHELPRFVARIRQMFRREELQAYFDFIEAAAAFLPADAETAMLEEAGLILNQAERQARLDRLAPLKDLLLSDQLGSA